MKTYTIKEVSDLFQLPASTLRYYEDRGLLTQVSRTTSGQRFYTEEHIGRLKAICCFKRAGITVADIHKYFLLEDDKFTNIDDILLILTKNKTQMENKMKQLSEAVIHIDEKLAYYEAIKSAIEEGRELPSWKDYMD